MRHHGVGQVRSLTQSIVAHSPATYRPSLEPGVLRSGRQTARCGKWVSRIERPNMSAALEPLALAPHDAAAFLSISKRSLSRLIRAGNASALRGRARCCFPFRARKTRRPRQSQRNDRSPVRKRLADLCRHSTVPMSALQNLAIVVDDPVGRAARSPRSMRPAAAAPPRPSPQPDSQKRKS